MVKVVRWFYDSVPKIVEPEKGITLTVLGNQCEAHLAKCNVELVINDKGQLVDAQVNEYKGIRPTIFTESEDGLTLSSAHEGESVIKMIEHYRKKQNDRDFTPEQLKEENKKFGL